LKTHGRGGTKWFLLKAGLKREVLTPFRTRL